MGRTKRIKNDTILIAANLKVDFYKSDSGRQPVLDWINQLQRGSRKRLARDIRRLQMGWPIGMPLVRKIESGLWEMRSKTPDGTARLLFTIERRRLVFLHGFIKKSRKLRGVDSVTAKQRLAKLRKGWQQ